MAFLNEFLPIIIYILLIVLITFLIVVTIKVSKTMDKVDSLVDDVDHKMKSLDPVFDLVEGVSSKATLISDKFLGFIMRIANKLFSNKGKKEE